MYILKTEGYVMEENKFAIIYNIGCTPEHPQSERHKKPPSSTLEIELLWSFQSSDKSKGSKAVKEILHHLGVTLPFIPESHCGWFHIKDDNYSQPSAVISCVEIALRLHELGMLCTNVSQDVALRQPLFMNSPIGGYVYFIRDPLHSKLICSIKITADNTIRCVEEGNEGGHLEVELLGLFQSTDIHQAKLVADYILRDMLPTSRVPESVTEWDQIIWSVFIAVDLHEHRLLVNRFYETGERRDPNSSACIKDNCIYCNKMDNDRKLRWPLNKSTYNLPIKANCKSSNLVYCITCNSCGKRYVGQTRKKLCVRMRAHYRNVKQKDMYFGKHFNDEGHKGLEDLKISVLAFEESLSIRRDLEQIWIRRLGTKKPGGLKLFIHHIKCCSLH